MGRPISKKYYGTGAGKIVIHAYVNGDVEEVSIVGQKGVGTYIVQPESGDPIRVKLVDGIPAAEGEACIALLGGTEFARTINANDIKTFSGNTYKWVIDIEPEDGQVDINEGLPKVDPTVTVTIASPAVFTLEDHGLIAGQTVVFATTGALPTGLTAGATYYVIAAGLTADTFSVSTTSGGAAVNTTGSQSGTHTVSS